jgi:hypothetical protein
LKKPRRAEIFRYDVFNKTRFNDCKHAYKASPKHVDGVSSAYNKCVKHFYDFQNQRQSISSKLSCASEEAKELYQIYLTSSLECSKFLITQGMAFRGHDEFSTSMDRGNFVEMIDWYKDKKEIVRNAFSHSAMNCKLTSPYIQKDIVRCCAEEIIDVIMGGIEDRNNPF